MSFIETNPLGFVIVLLLSPVIHELGHIITAIICGEKPLAIRFSPKNLVPEVVIDLRNMPANKMLPIASAGIIASIIWAWGIAPILFAGLTSPVSAIITLIALTNFVPLSKKISSPEKKYIIWKRKGAERLIAEIDAEDGDIILSDGVYIFQSVKTVL